MRQSDMKNQFSLNEIEYKIATFERLISRGIMPERHLFIEYEAYEELDLSAYDSECYIWYNAVIHTHLGHMPLVLIPDMNNAISLGMFIYMGDVNQCRQRFYSD